MRYWPFLNALSLLYVVLLHGLDGFLGWPSDDAQILLTAHIIIMVNLPLYNFTPRLLHLFGAIEFPHVVLHAADLPYLQLVAK